MVAAAVFGIPAIRSLPAGGFQDPSAESSRAAAILSDRFGHSDMQLILLLTTQDGVSSESARRVAAGLQQELRESPFVTNLTSTWTAPPAAAGNLVSRDRKSGLIVAGITGGENDAQKHAAALTQALSHDRNGVRVTAGGIATAYAEVNTQSERDLLTMESIAIPLCFVVLVWVFGGLVASVLPLAVALFAIVGSVAVLRAITFVTDVSTFALNLTVALGLALAIDYTLLIISRYRDELADGGSRHAALASTMRTAGRTVMFSALTVALALLTLVMFPMYFVRSFAYSGVAVVLLAAVAALVIAPAAIVLLDEHIDAFDMRRLIRRLLRKSAPEPKAVTELFWYRATKAVMRRAIPIGIAIFSLLLVLGGPFLSLRLGFPDDRVLPTSASARDVGDKLREDFNQNAAAAVTIVASNASGIVPGDIDDYAARLSRAPNVTAVSAPTEVFINGVRAGNPVDGSAGIHDGTVFFTVSSAADLFSPASERQLDALHAIPGPAGAVVEIGGRAQINRDSVESIVRQLPWVLGAIGLLTFFLMFVMTGSVVLPVEGLLLNILSLAAAFGAMVWIFQQGHLSGLGTCVTGTLVANMPVLVFCIAFGLSMDYQIFLVTRIREFWSTSAKTRAANVEAVALGLARTGRVVTAAALLMSISFAALIPSQLSFMRMLGLGLTLAVLADATLVRMLLLPAFMRVMGRANWWAPRIPAQITRRVGIQT
jgi:RND superfamily putative drug exporter